MTTETTTLLSTWLRDTIGSHDIYPVTVLAELPAPVAYDPAADTLIADGRTIKLGAMTPAQFDEAYGAVRHGDPKGAFLDPELPTEVRMFGGYWLSAALDRLLTGENAGGQYNGRGFAHRASIDHLAFKGF